MSRGLARSGRNVLVVTLRYPPYVAGGYELLTEDVVRALRARGHRVTVLAGRGERFEGEAEVLPWLEPDLDSREDLFGWAAASSNVERFRLHFLRLANWRATRRALDRTGAEALLFFNLGLVSLAPVLAARCQGVPTLGYVADLWPLNHWVREWRVNEQRAATKPVQLAALTRAWRIFRGLTGLGRVLVPSEFVAGELARDGIERAALGVLPLGLAPGMALSAENFDARPRAQGEPLRVVCSSMLWSGKGQHVLLEACALAASRGVELELALAGGGSVEYTDQLRALAAAPELAGRVRLLGMLSPEALSTELRSAHVFALPSQWGEPFGLATLEAMAHGLCPLVSDAGASPEIVRHERDGLVFEAGSVESLAKGLERLAANDAEREAFARSARGRVRTQYDHTEFVDRLEAELEGISPGGAR